MHCVLRNERCLRCARVCVCVCGERERERESEREKKRVHMFIDI